LFLFNFFHEAIIAPEAMVTRYGDDASGVVTGYAFVIVDVDFHHESFFFVEADFFNCVVAKSFFDIKTPNLKQLLLT
jgi:hypothetical protein